MATHSSILAWKIPWTEKPGGLPSTGSQRVGHDWVTNTWLLKKLFVSWWIFSYRMFRSSEEEPVYILKRSSKRKLLTRKGAPLTSCPALQSGSNAGLGLLPDASHKGLILRGEAGDSVCRDSRAGFPVSQMGRTPSWPAVGGERKWVCMGECAPVELCAPVHTWVLCTCVCVCACVCPCVSVRACGGITQRTKTR